MRVGEERSGTVVRTESFGAIIDLGGPVEGVVSVVNLAWRRFRHPSEVVSVGERVKVRVLDIDVSRRRISLSLKDPDGDPLLALAERVGDVVVGTVAKAAPIGVFVALEKDVEGLLPRIGDAVPPPVGSEVQVRIVDVNTEDRRVSLAPADR
nr:S1 RNA-binding domain-containing protein [Actinomadura rayongensis]